MHEDGERPPKFQWMPFGRFVMNFLFNDPHSSKIIERHFFKYIRTKLMFWASKPTIHAETIEHGYKIEDSKITHDGVDIKESMRVDPKMTLVKG